MQTETTETIDPNTLPAEDQLILKAVIATKMLDMNPAGVFIEEAFRFASMGAAHVPNMPERLKSFIDSAIALMDGSRPDLPENADIKQAIAALLERSKLELLAPPDATLLSEGVTLTEQVGYA